MMKREAIKIIQQIKNLTGMDSNTIYTIITTAIIGIVVPSMNKIKGKRENAAWGIKATLESELFFLWVMLISFLEILLAWMFYTLIQGIIIIFLRVTISPVLLIVLYLSIMYYVICFHFKIGFIRKRLLGSSKLYTLLSCLPALILGSEFMLVNWNMHNSIYGTIAMLSFLVTEAFGLIVFRGRYAKYNYSFAKIILSDGKVIDEISVEKISVERISKSPNWIKIALADKEIRVKADKIDRVEYYGEPKIIFHPKIFSVK